MKAEEALKRKQVLVVADRLSKLSGGIIDRLQSDGHSTMLVDSLVYHPAHHALELDIALKPQYVAVDMNTQELLADSLLYINEIDISTSQSLKDETTFWDDLVTRYIKSTILAIDTVLPKMIERGKGEIIHVFGLTNAKSLSYSAVNEFMKCMMVEIAAANVDQAIQLTNLEFLPNLRQITSASYDVDDLSIAECVSWILSRPPAVNITNMQVSSLEKTER